MQVNLAAGRRRWTLIGSAVARPDLSRHSNDVLHDRIPIARTAGRCAASDFHQRATIDHAIQAFEVGAVDYVMKPIAPGAAGRGGLRESAVERSPSRRLEQVFVRDGEKCWIVRLADVFLMESEGNYTRLCFGSDRPLIRRSLSALEEHSTRQSFFRANRKQIVNLKWVQETAVGIGGALAVTLRSDKEVEISRRAAARLREVMSL